MKNKIFSILLSLILMSPGVSFGAVQSYGELLTAIRGVRTESRARVEKAVVQEKVREAWETGKLIDEHVLQHKERAEYGKQVIERLAKDLGMSASELYRMMEFYRTYPILAHARELTWSDYRELLAINDAEVRKALAEQAALNQWSRTELRQAIQKSKSPLSTIPEERLISSPGIPNTYRVVRGPKEKELLIDLGFSNYLNLSEVVDDATPFKEGDIVQFITPFSKGGKGDFKISLPTGQAGPNPSLQKRGTEGDLYTYRADITKVLDGDTVKAVVTLGFGFTTQQTLRLRGIDAPEIFYKDSATKKADPSLSQTATHGGDGMEAKKFLESVIANPGGVKQSQGGGIAASQKALLAMTKPQVLIKTVKSDKYDRYLVDVFANDVYVNQELLDQGHAIRVQD